jgi:TonB family protein
MRSLALGIVVLTASTNKTFAQSGVSVVPHGEVVLTKLMEPSYPPLARQTRIAGDVEVVLEIKQDGSVQSAVIVSGHVLLQRAALDSAQRSQFECRKCGESVTSLRLVYTFQLVGPEHCCTADDSSKDIQPGQPIPRVIQSQDHVTLIDHPVCICDPRADVTRERSIKCLYLWRCGSR